MTLNATQVLMPSAIRLRRANFKLSDNSFYIIATSSMEYVEFHLVDNQVPMLYLHVYVIDVRFRFSKSFYFFSEAIQNLALSLIFSNFSFNHLHFVFYNKV